MPFRNAIRFDSVRYAYVGAPSPAVQDVSFSIPKGQVVGIVGASGSGKTTLVNLLLGLMNPDAGRIAVDDSDIAGDLAAWRACIGYVPQDIFLLDASLKRNIAFGLPDEEIDPVRLESAIVAARLQEFVAGLPDGTDTLVGERGSRLSGGQRQRIGIARALYGMPSVLVLDEATSALDQETERHVVEAIEKLRGELTIVVVAHRLSTLRNCDVLVELKDGRVARQGTHRELFGAVSEEARSA